MRVLLFSLFFVSGAAGLVYEVAWARSLGVVFGASHLAISTVLAVYMGGQALGSALLGARADRTDRPLRLYGLLELGIALAAMGFLALMAVYPTLYVPLARVAEESPVYLTLLRAAFGLLAMIVPTTLMGGTLPVLSRFLAGRGDGLVRQLSLLYAFNTFGAVAGALLAGFVLLPNLGVRSTVALTAAVSACVGVASVALQRRVGRSAPAASTSVATTEPVPSSSDLALRLTLLGAGISGFCALGYEVLWTRMLTLVVGTSVYSFTLMLVAFLAGIGLGSHAFGLLRGGKGGGRAPLLVFAATQVLIGVTALGVTVLMPRLPQVAVRAQELAATLGLSRFGGRLASSYVIALAYMLAPAFLMGVAFPAAGAAWAGRRGNPGAAVGRLLSANTVGAILGSVTSGFVLVPLFGIERSLQLLVVVNVTAGLAIAASLAGRRWAVAAVAAAGAVLLVARGASETAARAWDARFFASYANTGRIAETAEAIREHLDDTEVLYYHEGIDSTVSVVRSKGDTLQSFIVNGRPEASNAPIDVQLQRTLGHVPMLLHPHPRSVFVLGTGSGMTLGATSIHPEVERIVLAEIEPAALGVARTFAAYNANVLDDPRLHVVFNDGRNFLAGTSRKFDVITSDPIHPWSGGAAYLYTREYFRIVAEHLAPGGIASHWLPLYELSTQDLRTVVHTFADAFPYVMVWLTYYDAALIGSNSPIVIDEREVARRLSRPAIRADLAPIQMGTAEDLLSHFALGNAGARAFAQRGGLNTDDGLALEFSAPRSQGVRTDARNVVALAAFREGLSSYLAQPGTEAERRSDAERWTRNLATARLFDRAHALYLAGQRAAPEFLNLLAAVRARDPEYAPLRFLLEEKALADRCVPALVADRVFEVTTPGGIVRPLRISAVRQFLGRGRVLVSFVDNQRREIYAQNTLTGPYEALEARTAQFVDDTLRVASAAVRVPGGGSAEVLRSAIQRSAALSHSAPR